MATDWTPAAAAQGDQSALYQHRDDTSRDDHAQYRKKANPIATSDLADGAVTHVKLAINAVESANILDGTITGADFAATAADGVTIEVGGGWLRVKDAGITTAKLADANVTQAKLEVAQQFEAGDLKITAKTSPSSGWLVCDGSAVSRTTYATLFAAISTVFGVGDGSTTFNVPDYRGRVIVGAGTGPGLTIRSTGTTGGEETHLLTSTEMPGHAHGTQDTTSTTGGAAGANNMAVLTGNTATGIATGSAGGGAAHNNMPPFGVANVFIKT